MSSLHDFVEGPQTAIAVMDIGAMPEGDCRYRPLVERGLASVTAFEPQAEQRQRVPKTVTCLPHVLGDGTRKIFHVTRYPGCSSIFEPDPTIIDLFSGIGAAQPDGNFHVVKRIPVETTRLDDIPDLPAPDYVKLDVQGAELEIMRHGERRLSGVVVIECEVEFLPLYKGQPLFGDIDSYLRSKGFMFHKFVDVAGRCFRPIAFANPATALSQLLWADAVFVKQFGALAGWADAQLWKAATILHDVYRSYDLVATLLAALDARAGTERAREYCDKLRASGPLPLLVNNMKTTL